MELAAIIDGVFSVSPAVRYVAVYSGGVLQSRQRGNLGAASSGESDRYEELIVNPALITLLRQRGNIDCGGFSFALIRYGNFTQFVQPLRDGHLSVALETSGAAHEIAELIRALPMVREELA